MSPPPPAANGTTMVTGRDGIVLRPASLGTRPGHDGRDRGRQRRSRSGRPASVSVPAFRRRMRRRSPARLAQAGRPGKWRDWPAFLTGRGPIAISMPSQAGLGSACVFVAAPTLYGVRRRQNPNPTERSRSGPDPSAGIEHEDENDVRSHQDRRQAIPRRRRGHDQGRQARRRARRDLQLGEVLVVGGDTPRSARRWSRAPRSPAEVLEQGRGPKVIAFKKRRRKNSRRKRGHRQEFTLVRITEILTDGAKPTKAASEARTEADARERRQGRGRRGSRRPRRPRPRARRRPASRNRRQGQQEVMISSRNRVRYERIQDTELMAHKKAGGSSRNGRDSAGQRLGVKLFRRRDACSPATSSRASAAPSGTPAECRHGQGSHAVRTDRWPRRVQHESQRPHLRIRRSDDGGCGRVNGGPK